VLTGRESGVNYEDDITLDISLFGCTKDRDPAHQLLVSRRVS
jgi:hypothetical protein